jgi:hypothetical protein
VADHILGVFCVFPFRCALQRQPRLENLLASCAVSGSISWGHACEVKHCAAPPDSSEEEQAKRMFFSESLPLRFTVGKQGSLFTG